MSKIFCPLLGVSFQIELGIMTVVDAIVSLHDWSSPFNLVGRIDQIWKTTMLRRAIHGHYDQYIKTVLSWVVVSRMVIAHLYTITYTANLYAIVTWCHGKVLIPWLVLSAFKNFFLESIVFLVVIILYMDGNLSGILFTGIMMDKLISLVIATHSWFTIKSFYIQLENTNRRRSTMRRRKSSTPMAPNIILGMSVKDSKLDDNTVDFFNYKPIKFASLPNLNCLDIELTSELDNKYNHKLAKSASTVSILAKELDKQEDESHTDIVDDPKLTSAEKAIRILGLTPDNITNSNTNISVQVSEEIPRELIGASESTLMSKDNSNNYQSTSCYCPTFKDTEEDDEGVKVRSNINLSKNDDQSKIDKNQIDNKNLNDDYLEWVNQWSLKQLLKYKKAESNKMEDNAFFPIGVDHFSRWSSEEELNYNVNLVDDSNKFSCKDNINQFHTRNCLPDISFGQIKYNDFHEQSSESWIENLQLIGSSFETTIQSRHINDNLQETNESNHAIYYDNEEMNRMKINRSWMLDGMTIELLDNGSLNLTEKQSMIMKCQINLSSMDKEGDTVVRPFLEDDFDNLANIKIHDESNEQLYKSLTTQTSIDKLLQPSSYYTSLSMNNSVSKKNCKRETVQEREERELKALKAYNAKTLQKDKRKYDMEKLKLINRKESNLLGKSQSLKSNDDNQLFKRKYRNQTNNVNGMKDVGGGVKMASVSSKKIQVSQMGRHLNRIRASENISLRYPIKFLLKKPSPNNTVITRSFNKLLSMDPRLKLTLPTDFDIKNKIAQLDWTVSSWESNVHCHNVWEKSSFMTESTMLDMIDDGDTMDLLQSAFSHDSSQTTRGLYLGAASTDFYSLSEQTPNVFEEILKATHFRPAQHEYNNASKTSEIDFGECYYQESIIIGGSDEILRTVEYSEFIDSPYDSEMFTINYWINKLQELLLNNSRYFQDTQKLRRLAETQGFHMLREFINNICNSSMISVSTVTSGLLICVEKSTTTSAVTINNNSIE